MATVARPIAPSLVGDGGQYCCCPRTRGIFFTSQRAVFNPSSVWPTWWCGGTAFHGLWPLTNYHITLITPKQQNIPPSAVWWNEYQISTWVIIINSDGGCGRRQPFSADSQCKLVDLVWGLAATWRPLFIHRMNRVNFCNSFTMIKAP